MDVYLGEKGLEDLTPGDPVIHRVGDLQAQAARMRAAVARACGVAPVPIPASKTISKAPAPIVARVTTPPAPLASPASEYVDPAHRAAFDRAGYRCVKDTVKKVALFEGTRSGREVYLVNGRPGITVVVHPDMLACAQAAVSEPASAIRIAPFNHDNLRTFPAHDNGGENPVRYGRAVDCRTLGALEDFLRAFDAA